MKREIRLVFNDNFATVWEDMGTSVHGYLDPAAAMDDNQHHSLRRRSKSLPIPSFHGSLASKTAFRDPLFRRYSHKLLDYALLWTQPPDFKVLLSQHSASALIPSLLGTLRAPELSTPPQATTVRRSTFPPHATLSSRPSLRKTKLHQLGQNFQPVMQVMLPGPVAFLGVLASAMVGLAGEKFVVNDSSDQLEGMKERAENGRTDQCRIDTPKFWSQKKHRIICQVFYASPITMGADTKRYTKGWASIELDNNKIDWTYFRGNAIAWVLLVSFVGYVSGLTAILRDEGSVERIYEDDES
ncbi:hypothetical protein FRB96_001712 [Tulasnella sp. 330]|nr:hypothetical protein FRB96_001712 [Tulasnella sp. 330]